MVRLAGAILHPRLSEERCAHADVGLRPTLAEDREPRADFGELSRAGSPCYFLYCHLRCLSSKTIPQTASGTMTAATVRRMPRHWLFQALGAWRRSARPVTWTRSGWSSSSFIAFAL